MLLLETAILYKMLLPLNPLLLELMLNLGNSTQEESCPLQDVELNWTTESWQSDIPTQPNLEFSGKLKTHGEPAGESKVSLDSETEMLAVSATLHLSQPFEENLLRKFKLLLHE